MGPKSWNMFEIWTYRVCPSLYQSRFPFVAHWASSSDHFDDPAFGGWESSARPLPFADPKADVAWDSESWNCVINFGFARSTKASMARRSKLTPRMKVIDMRCNKMRISSDNEITNLNIKWREFVTRIVTRQDVPSQPFLELLIYHRSRRCCRYSIYRVIWHI